MDAINDDRSYTGNESMAASKIDEGTDVNYGELTRKMAKVLKNIQMLMFNTTTKC